MKNEGLLSNIQEKQVAQVTGTIPLTQISNTNRQQFTSNNNNITFNRARLTGFSARTADETLKSIQSINIPLWSFYTVLPPREKPQTPDIPVADVMDTGYSTAFGGRGKGIISSQYRSASNRLLARAADKTQRRDSHSKGDLSRSTRSSRSTFTTP
ncbi:hypothetical protein AVEN_72761-1 [Araneus ventricosus]|uniref:Uncharacterized protein n=1 Tax=Araneus ventricosus TaxID=182803 RepID=A0A4Y2KC54_ARAVE|nr:hypothetical protein AVEN_72761-1 [Araneus ventricosus]